MANLSMYNFLTLNGFYKGDNGDISWHRHGGDEAQFSKDSLQADNILLFGRVTYDLMSSYWPTPLAEGNLPEVIEGMNNTEKIVFSKTMKNAEWKNTRVVNGNLIEEVKKLKKGSKDITILGSGSIATQLADAGLIDAYLVMIDPVAIGSGTPIFNGLQHTLNLKLIDSRVFNSGVVLLTYKPE